MFIYEFTGAGDGVQDLTGSSPERHPHSLLLKEYLYQFSLVSSWEVKAGLLQVAEQQELLSELISGSLGYNVSSRLA